MVREIEQPFDSLEIIIMTRKPANGASQNGKTKLVGQIARIVRKAGLHYEGWRYVSKRVRQECELRPAKQGRKVPNVLTGSGFSQGFGPIGRGTDLIGNNAANGLAVALDSALAKLNRDGGDAEQGGSDPWGGYLWQVGANPADPIDYQTNNFGCVDNALLENSRLTRSQLTNVNNSVFSAARPIPCHSSGSMTDSTLGRNDRELET